MNINNKEHINILETLLGGCYGEYDETLHAAIEAFKFQDTCKSNNDVSEREHCSSVVSKAPRSGEFLSLSHEDIVDLLVHERSVVRASAAQCGFNAGEMFEMHKREAIEEQFIEARAINNGHQLCRQLLAGEILELRRQLKVSQEKIDDLYFKIKDVIVQMNEADQYVVDCFQQKLNDIIKNS